MKTFKKLLGEVAQPVSPDEQRFKAQHIVQKFDYPVKDSDAMFKGTISGPAARPADQGDSMNYDKAYSSRKAPTSDVGESVESTDNAVNEISKDMAQRYYSKSQDSMRKSMNTMIDTEKARKPEKKKEYDDARKTFHKRGKGSDMAAKRLAYKGKNEEAEQIDEISMDLAKKAFFKRKQQAFGAANRRDMKTANKLADKKNKTKAYIQAREEVEQIDEISKGLAGRYIKKAQMDTAHAGDQIATGSIGQAGASPDVKKGYEKQRTKGIAKLVRRRVGTRDAVSKLTGTARVPAKEEVEVSEMKKIMGMKKFMEAKELGENEKAALAKEINKSAEASKEGKKKVTLKKAPWEKNEKVEEGFLDEDLTHQTVKPPNHTKKFSHRDNRDIHSIEAPGSERHTVTSSQADAHDKTAAHHNEVADAHTKAGEKASSPTLQRLHHQASVHHKKAAEAHFNASHSSSGADKDGSIQKKAKDMHMAYHLTMHANKMSQEVRNKGTKAKRSKEKVNETLKSALKKPIQTTTPDGKTRTVMRSIKSTDRDEHGQDKIKESVEFIDEAVKAGNMKLKDGARIKVANEDAKAINALFKGLNSANKRKMEQVMMTDKKGFNEILGFAKNAM